MPRPKLSPANLPAQIRHRCAAAGWTLTKLAERAGLHPVGLAKVLSGKRAGTQIVTLLALARALGCSADDLLKPLRKQRATLPDLTPNGRAS